LTSKLPGRLISARLVVNPDYKPFQLFLSNSVQFSVSDWTLIPPMLQLKVPVTLTTKGQLAAMYYSAEKTKNIGSLEKLIWASSWIFV